MNNHVRGRRVAIIGGAGFIGHNLALSLVAEGGAVELVDSLQVNNLLYFASGAGGHGASRDLNLRIINERLDLIRLAGVALHPQDARDYHALCRILAAIKPDIIVHLAAVSHAGRSNKDPYSTFDHSLRTLENALDYARSERVQQFVFLSSSMAYGNFQTDSVTEDHPLEPIGIYGALKVAGEKMVIAYQQVFDLPYTIIRPSALYGPRCVSGRVIQVFIENALKGEALRIDGDGAERLDFTYIDDLTAGLNLVIGNPTAYNQVFNLTYGRSRSIQEVVTVLRRDFPAITIDSVPRDKLMPFRGTLRTDKIEALLGYTPSWPIELGVPQYVQWYRQLVGADSLVVGG